MSGQHDPDTYCQILFKGRLSEHWTEWFENMEITHNAHEETVLRGPIVDQSELQGILSTIGMLNMTLISVTQIDAESNRESHTLRDLDTDDPSDSR